MDNLFNSGISIEKMAAFLDGNLSANDMQEVSAIIDSDASFRQFIEANSMVDESLSAFTLSDMALPQELQTLDFELPNVSEEFISNENLHFGGVSENACVGSGYDANISTEEEQEVLDIREFETNLEDNNTLPYSEENTSLDFDVDEF